jgi:HAD superfamily hydrolase (TIGR01509 family)
VSGQTTGLTASNWNRLENDPGKAVSMTRCGLLLDLDGTLADSLPVMRTVYQRLLAAFDRQGSDDEFDRLNGPPLSVVAAHLLETHKLDVPSQLLITRYRELIADAYLTVPPRKGAHALLETLRDGGVCTAVVTSNARIQALNWLETTQLEPLIDVVVGFEDTQKGKPDPEPYRMALKRLGATPDLSLAVEDTLTGARSAVAAGLKTAVIGGASAIDLDPGMIPIAELAEVRSLLSSSRSPNGKK